METNWQQDKRWSDKILSEIKRNLGEYLIGEPPVEEDTERNTDLIVLKMEVVRIGCRIRRFKYFEKYQNEFTIRAGRPSLVKTELTKIIEGWGDYFFYGFSNQQENALALWRLCDLNIFRLWFNREILKTKQYPGKKKENKDNSSYFLVFNFNDLPKEFIYAKSPQNFY